MKKEDYISWNDFFMSLAILSSFRSKDPNTKVGSCIADENNKIVGLGYNGFPSKIKNNDNILPWNRDKSPLESKYLYVIHAERNAIRNSSGKLEGSTIYITLAPCNNCAQDIIESGITKVIYLDDKYHDTDSCIAARKMFDLSKVEYKQYVPDINEIIIKLRNKNE